MQRYIDELLILVNDIDAEFSNIEAIIGYAKKIDLEFRKNEIGNRLDILLIKWLIRRIRDIYFDVSGFQELINRPFTCEMLKYFEEEFRDISLYLNGTKNYYAVFLVQENLLEQYSKDFEVILRDGKCILNGISLSQERQNEIEKILQTKIPSIRQDIILFEVYIVILNLNKMLTVSNKELLTSGLGFCNHSLSFNDELVLLNNYLKVIQGQKSYRLSICINQVKVLYSNIDIRI